MICWKKERKKAHLFFRFKVGVVLGHVLRWPLLDQTATQQPDGQASYKHANVRDEHSYAVPRICPNHTGDKQKTQLNLTERTTCFLKVKINTSILEILGLDCNHNQMMERGTEYKKLHFWKDDFSRDLWLLIWVTWIRPTNNYADVCYESDLRYLSLFEDRND